MNMQAQERRKLDRFNLKIPAKIQVTDSVQEKKMLDLFTSNICSGGAFFHTPQPLPEGVQVKLDLVLPLDKLKKLKDESKHVCIEISGRVLRSESTGMAICFNEDYKISPCTRTSLTQDSGGDNPLGSPNLNQTTSQN